MGTARCVITLISRSEVDLAQLRDAIGSNLEELQRLAGIVNEMLFVAQAERGAKARLDPADSLAKLATGVIEYHEAALVEAGLRAVVVGDVVVAVDRRLIRRALSNLHGIHSECRELVSDGLAQIRNIKLRSYAY